MADAFWKVTIAGQSGAGSTVPGTAAIVTEWISTAGKPAGSSWGGFIPAAQAAGFLRLNAAGADAAARLAAEFDADDTDFYRCFRPGGGLAITIGPDHQPVADVVETTCTTEVSVAPDRHGFLVALTAAWPDDAGHGAGRLIVDLDVDRDGSIHGPVIEGDPLP